MALIRKTKLEGLNGVQRGSVELHKCGEHWHVAVVTMARVETFSESISMFDDCVDTLVCSIERPAAIYVLSPEELADDR